MRQFVCLYDVSKGDRVVYSGHSGAFRPDFSQHRQMRRSERRGIGKCFSRARSNNELPKQYSRRHDDRRLGPTAEQYRDSLHEGTEDLYQIAA